MARLAILESTLEKLFALSGNCCAFPGCGQAVVNERGGLIAEVCHIEAAEKKGQRYNPAQSDEDRRGIDNLLILCPNHHKVTDNVAEYPVERLRQMKREHEGRSGDQRFKIGEALAARLYEQVARQLGRPTRPISLPFPSIGPLLKGRDEFLQRLRESLRDSAEGHATAIVGKAVHGLGGVGKTRLAVEYAWQHVEDYTALLFVVADSPESLSRNLAALCAPAVLDLPEQDVPEEAPRRLAALHWLQGHPGWLLILDNIDTPAAARAAEDLLSQLHGGHVLLTGRLSTWSGCVEALELDVLAEDDAVEFLLARTDSRRRKAEDDAEQARTLAVELGQLALALEQAGAYIAVNRLTLAGYLDHWRDRHDRVLEWFDERLMQYPQPLAVTWQTSVDQLTAPARRLLQRLAWFAPDPIPESLLEVEVVRGSPSVVRGSPDPAPEPTDRSPEPGRLTVGGFGEVGRPAPSAAAADPRDALAELETYSLVTRSGESPTFTVHRLVQDVTRRSLRDDTTHHALTESLRWVNAAFVGDPDDVRTWPTLDPLAPHARAAAGHADQAGIADPTAGLMNQLGVLLLNKALYAEAAPLTRRALAIDEQSFGTDHPKVAIRLNNLAQFLQATNRLAEAEPLMRRALAIDEQSFGTDHPNVARDLNNLAHLLQATNRLAEAEPLMSRVVSIFETSLGENHPNVAVALNNLAHLLQATNRLAEAEPLYRRALAIDEQSFGTDHPNVARDLNNLAHLLQATNRLAEAEPLMRRALAIDEQSFGTDHPNVARDLNNLAHLLQATNRLAGAEPLMRRALAIDERSFGTDHPDVARDLNNLALLLQATNRLAEAEPLMARVVSILETSLGENHPNVATALDNLAHFLTATNRLAEAEPLMRRALAIDEQSFGTDHPNVAIRLNNLALSLKATNRLAEAEPLMARVVSIFETSLGENHPNVATALNNLAQLLQATDRLAEAEPLMRRALAIDEQSFGTDHPKVATDLNNLAQLLKATNRLAEAEPLMARVVSIFETSLGENHPNVATALNNLGQLLQVTNRLAEAEPLMRRALAIDEQSFGTDHPNVARDLYSLAHLLQATYRLAEALPLMERSVAIYRRFE